jgi:hypothetical protein
LLRASTDVTVKVYESPGVSPVTTAEFALEAVSTVKGAPDCGVTLMMKSVAEKVLGTFHERLASSFAPLRDVITGIPGCALPIPTN